MVIFDFRWQISDCWNHDGKTLGGRPAQAASAQRFLLGRHAKKMEPSEGYIEVEGGKLHYLDWGGSGPSAHFLHGNGFCAGTYSPFIEQLAGELHVVASDVRGHGASDFSGIQPIRSWKVFAEDLKTVVCRTGRPPVIGMGHSLGAVSTCIAASVYPELFRCLILVDPVFLNPARLAAIGFMRMLGLRGRLPRARAARRRRQTFRGKAEALRLFLSGRGIFKTWSPEFVEAYLECGLLEHDAKTAVLKCDPELEAQIFESIPLRTWSFVKRVQCPVLAIRGELSEVFTAQAAERLKHQAADGEVVTIAGAGHFPTMEKSQECVTAVREFLCRRKTL
jgi:pimeloyl-ACP methyl ester carboxylesterase